MTQFIFELAASATMKKIGELTQARNRNLTLALDKGGAFDFSLPLDDDIAKKVNEVSTCAVIKMNDNGLITPVWSGPVWNIVESTPNTLQVGCVGWLQTVEKRVTKPWWVTPNGNLVYANIDAGAIALDLITRSNADQPAGAPIYVTAGTAETTQLRTRTYQPYSGVLSEVENLSTIEAGYDLLVDPGTRKLNIFAKISTPQPKIFFEHGTGAGNTTSVTRTTDATKMCNRMIAYSTIGYAIAEDLDSQAAYGVFEEAVSLTDVTNLSILQAFADGEVAIRSLPVEMHSFEPRETNVSPPTNAARDALIFRDFNIGDIVNLKADKGRLQITRQAVRLFGATVAFQPNGNVKLSNIQTNLSA